MNIRVETERPWIVVRTRPMMERQACAEMEDAGMVVYCPIYKREYRNRAKKWIIREFPLLQGYVFLRADTVNWYNLAGCKQVASILRSIGGEPIGISEVAVEDIRSRQLAGDFDTLRVHDEYVKPGQKVKVSTGALAGLESVVASVKNTTAVNILVQIFGREVQATVPLETLERKA